MTLKKGLTIGLCILLITVVVMFATAIGRVLDLFQGNPNPTQPSQTTPSASETEPQPTETQPTDPTTEPTTEPTEPSTEPTEPSTEPPTEPTDPPTEPTDPPTEPTEPPHQHQWTLVSSVPVTCDTYGYNIYTCEGCGKQDIPFDEQVAPPGHQYGIGQTFAPTCTQQGYTRYTCSVCNHNDDRNIKKALEHEFTFTKTIVSDCEIDGCDLYTCSRCKEEEARNVVPATGHTFSQWVFNQDGSIHRDCATCQKQQTGADLVVLNLRQTADGSILMVSVGIQGEPESFLFVVYDNLLNGTLEYHIDPVAGLVVTYQTADGSTKTLSSNFKTTPTIIVPKDDTPSTDPVEPPAEEPADPVEPPVEEPADPVVPPVEEPADPVEPPVEEPADPTIQ